MSDLYMSVLADPARLMVLRDAVRPRLFPSSAFDALTRVGARALDVPMVLVSLVDDQGQFFPGATGLLGEIAACRSTPLSHSICRHVVESGKALAIEDARVHPLVCTNPIVEELGVVGYLGIPLTTSDGLCLGSMCAMTFEPRVWTPADESALRDLADIALDELELRAELTYRERLADGQDPSLEAEGLPARSEDLLAHLHEGAASVDRQWRITYINDAGCKALEVEQSAVLGQDIWSAVCSLAGSPFETLLRDAAASRKPLELEAYVPQSERWYEVRAVPARHGLAVYFTDSTERRRAVEALAIREEQLRQAQKMEAIGALAGGVAHDFNNLLTVIRANCELLLDDIAPTDMKHADLREIQEAATRAAALTQQLLAFGRRQVVQPQQVDLPTTILSLAPMLRRLIPTTVQIETRCPPDLPAVFVDPGQLEQVIMNLVVNARDAMPGGGVVRVQASAVDLPVSFRDGTALVPPGRWVTLVVQDTGMGIDPTHLSRIFEPFFTTKEVGKGTGLGLATVFRIVDDAGGVIAVDSFPSRGTRIRIYFPVAHITPDASPARTSTRLITPAFV